ncbi:hypothetical protein K502DRAFT_322542 [Neoconidiobolus thromboides FSU 785]|nr:hypothetical protein K502DRAFT_322542 [Neoconidiobolus thromboides FSU 785]
MTSQINLSHYSTSTSTIEQPSEMTFHLPYHQNILNLPLHKVRAKPGRKPSPLEPANKRLAQNRIAQRAYRERKENHLRYLEERVHALEIINSDQNHMILRLQRENQQLNSRLQTSLPTNETTSLIPSSHSGGSSPLKEEFGFYNSNYKMIGCAEKLNKLNVQHQTTLINKECFRLPGIDSLLKASTTSDDEDTYISTRIWS